MTKVLENSELAPELHDQWNGQFGSGDTPPTGAGVMCRLEVVDIIDKVLIPPHAKRVIWSITDQNSGSFFPCVISSKSAGPISWSELKPIPDHYPVRSAPAANFDDGETVSDLLSAPFDNWRRWDCFITNAIAGGKYEKKLLEVGRANGFEPTVISEIHCPYIRLPDNWSSLYDNYAKKFRYTIRHGEKLLSDRGTLELRCFTEADNVDNFLHDFLSVEKLSWKEETGTSITQNPEQERFYSKLAPVAAATGLFRAYILYLDGAAIAHIYGLYCDDTFYCLKLSFVEAYKKCSPGIIITAMAIKDLINESAKLWDFVGPTEEYKKRWAKETYGIRTYVFFSRTLKGRALFFRRMLQNFLSR